MTFKTQVSEVKKLLWKAAKPLLHIGQGARHAKEEIESFVTDLQIPFVTARNGNDLFPWSHALYVGRPGTFAQRGANFAVQNADLYIAIGTRLSLPQTGYNSLDYARNAKIIQVDIDQAELDKGTIRHHLKICADAKEFMIELNKQWHEPTEWIQWSQWTRFSQYDPWLKRCQSWKERYPVCLPEYRDQKGSVNSYHFIDVLSDVLEEGDVIVSDMGFAFQNFHQAFRNKNGQRMLTNCGLAPMGWGLPAAVGASFASIARIVCITGDGGMMMNMQELATVKHHRLPIKIFVLNNGGYLTIKQTQQLGFGGRLMGVNEESGLSFPDFEQIAHAHGFAYWKIESHDGLRQRLENYVNWTLPVIVEIKMDPNQPQAPRALNRRNPDGTMNPTKLEDAHPFLDPEIIRKEME